LLASDLGLAHGIRESIRRAGLTLILESIGSRSALLSRLRSVPVDLVLAVADDAGGLRITEVMDQAQSLGERIPLITIGQGVRGSGPAQATSLDYVDANQLSRLSAMIKRALQRRCESDQRAAARLELERAAEHLRENQKLLTLGRLTASIVHEINNPLESLSNLLYLVEIDQDSREKRAEYLKLAQRELNRIVQISKQTLSFSRETSIPVRLQLAELIEEVLVLYRRKIAEKKVRVIRQYESSEDVTAFPGEMRQVFSNLITNAIEACSKNGRLILRIRNARKWSDEGVRGLSITVADNGSGISPEALKRLGEAFFTTKGQAGTGLGLWVTRSILTRYGASTRVRSSVSTEHHGTVFSIFIPTNMRPVAVVLSGTGSNNSSNHVKPAAQNPTRRKSAESRLEADELIAG
jgi:two-component system, NtrC family, sensor kinase